MIDAETLTKLVAAAAVGVVSIALGLQQVMKRWKSTSAETNILTLLHAELERMSTQNTLLSGYVNTLQLDANKINLQLGKLQIENQKLHAEIVCLTQEVVKLRSSLPTSEVT